MPEELKLKPISPVEEVLFLLYRNKLPVSIPDIAIIRDGVLRGLLYSSSATEDSGIVYDPGWPVVDFDTHQTRMYSTKRASEAAAKIDVAVNFFSKENSAMDAPVVMHVTAPPHGIQAGSSPSKTGNVVDVTCQFFTKSRFVEQLRSCKISDGLLFRYVPPANRHHHLIRAVFTPYILRVEQHEADAAIDDSALPMVERVSTSPGHCGSYHIVEPTDHVKRNVRDVCSIIFDFFRSQKAVVDRAILFFMQSSNGKVHFLWPGELQLKPWFLENTFDLSDADALSELDDRGHVSTTKGFELAAPSHSATQSASQYVPLVRHATASRPLAPSPLPAPLQPEAVTQLWADVRDFGFYNGEPERLKDALKRQIRSISRVQLPPSMELDDQPPYDDEFIAALCHPEKAEAYFFPNATGGQLRSRKSFLTRTKSKIFRFIDTDETQVEERSAKLEKSFNSFRRIRSGSVTTFSVSEESAAQRAATVLDPEISEILAKHVDDIGDSASFVASAIPEKNRAAAHIIQNLVPDMKHSGHIARLRRKYGFTKFESDEAEAECRRVARMNFASVSAVRNVERRKSTSSTASTISNQSCAASSLANSRKVSDAEVRLEKGWVDVLHVDHNHTTPFHRLATSPLSTTDHLLTKIIPKYDSKLAQGSLLGYLVGTEAFEPRIFEAPLDVPLEDCKPKRGALQHVSLGVTQAIPDAPVVETTNMHLSISEELIEQQFFDDGNKRRGTSQKKTMMEMMFGPYDTSVHAISSAGSLRRKRLERERAGHFDHPPPLNQTELSSSLVSAQQAFSDQLMRASQNDEKKQRQLNFQRHGISDAKERVQLIVGTFEDLVYQWASDPANDMKKIRKGLAGAPTVMSLHVPPSFFHLRRELRSLFVSLHFEEHSVEATSLPSYQQAITDDILEEVPQYVKIFSMQVTPVTVARVIAAAKLFASDVAALYAAEKWEVIERIRDMTESQGFTFVDAVLMVASSNLMERSSVSCPVMSFADVKV